MMRKNSTLEDVATTSPGKRLELTLNEVGLERVETQVSVDGFRIPARADASVSLIDPQSRGIHMSRLFKVLNGLHERELDWPWLGAALEQILASHEKLSDAGHVAVSFDLPVLRKALLSEEKGWRNYPVSYRVSSTRGKRELRLTARVLYSSTCPCSASLSRHAIKDKFIEDFTEGQLSKESVAEWLGKPTSFVALPHSQRSEAFCEFILNPDEKIPSALELIDEIEVALGTAVQAAVKREDEQEFARLNAQNLMFCEDAARKLKSALLERTDLADFQIEVRHFESLHAHDVVAKVGKFSSSL